MKKKLEYCFNWVIQDLTLQKPIEKAEVFNMFRTFTGCLKNRGAFTLVELLTAVAIVGLTIAVAFPGSTKSPAKSKFTTYKIQLRDVLQRARNIARTKQQCVTVDIQGQAVTVNAYQMAAPCAAPFLNLDSTFTINFDPSVTFTPFFTNTPFIFNSRGGTNYNAVSTMTISALGMNQNFSVYSLTGQIREN